MAPDGVQCGTIRPLTNGREVPWDYLRTAGARSLECVQIQPLQTIILRRSQCSSGRRGALRPTPQWMPNFSDKSGKRRLFRHGRRLTAGLPDVPTGGAPRGPADSAGAAMLCGRGWREIAPSRRRDSSSQSSVVAGCHGSPRGGKYSRRAGLYRRIDPDGVFEAASDIPSGSP